MINRRTFIGALGGSLAATSLPWGCSKHGKRLAMVTTEWRFWSHAWHMGERFLVGYPMEGRWHHSPIKLVSAYVDQQPENDLSRARAQEFGFPIYPSIAEALRCGGDKLDVDVVLLIGEHGRYPVNELGQTLYPRYEFFKEIVDIFRQDGRTVPVFNDRHLSWKWSWSKEMVDTAHAMGFPLLAGSSLPVTWRMPAIDMPYGAEVMCVAIGGVDSYDFHALETIQCMVERRQGGETGVVWLQGMRGNAVWKAMEQGSFERGGWDPQLFRSCLSRSQTLAQAETMNHRYPCGRVHEHRPHRYNTSSCRKAASPASDAPTGGARYRGIRFQCVTFDFGTADRHDVESRATSVQNGKPAPVSHFLNDLLQPLSKLFGTDHLWHRHTS